MPGRRAELLIGACGAAIGVGIAALETGEAVVLAATAIVGAALGPAERFPRGARCTALAALLAAAPTGSTVGTAVVVAGHTFSAGRREDLWRGVAWLVALLGAIVLAVAISDATADGIVPVTILVLAGWAGGRALREREIVAARLAERVHELDEERERMPSSRCATSARASPRSCTTSSATRSA